MNIDFWKDNNRFNARVSAIIYNSEKNKILLFKVDDGRNFYLLPGGRIEFYEDSKTAIKREIMEELGWNLEFDLCFIQENFLEYHNIKITQYCFCYKAIYKGKIDQEKITCRDNTNQTFCWVDISKINDYLIKPESCYDLILNTDNYIKHIIEYDNNNFE